MNLPTHIQNAVNHGLLEVNEAGQVISCKKDEVETIMGIARVVEKIQPTTIAQSDDTTDQEAIVLCRVLNAPSGVARELWSQLRIAFGVSHDQGVPSSLWSNPAFRALGIEVDRTYLGQHETQLISRDSLIRNYSEPNNQNKIVEPIEFKQVVANLTAEGAMAAYGNEESEWAVALDLLRKARVRAIYNDTLQAIEQAQKADTKLEKQIEFQQGNAKNSTDILFGVDGKPGLLDKIMDGREAVQPISTGIPSMDLDMEGGVYPAGAEFTGGRLFTLAARTGVGKTILAAQAAVGLAKGGLKVGFISAELDEDEIWTRIWSCATRTFNKNNAWASVGDIKQPGPGKAQEIAHRVSEACSKLQECGGELMVEAPWGADVESVVNILRSMKAKNPEMRAAIIDHFHALSRHKGAPTSEAAMMEDRAYKLMTVAKELGIDLIVLAQMNRVGMDIASSKQAPGLDQIRGTDAISHVSHAVWIVRRAPGGDDQPSNRELEFWHSKTRGRQAVWNGNSMRGTRHFIEVSKLEMDYAHSGVQSDNTPNLVN